MSWHRGGTEWPLTKGVAQGAFLLLRLDSCFCQVCFCKDLACSMMLHCAQHTDAWSINYFTWQLAILLMFVVHGDACRVVVECVNSTCSSRLPCAPLNSENVTRL